MLYNVVFIGLIIFFCYFYAQIQFKTEDISESLKKNGGFIPGIRPGEKTAEFLDFVVNRLTLLVVFMLSLFVLCQQFYLMLQKFLSILVEHHYLSLLVLLLIQWLKLKVL